MWPAIVDSLDRSAWLVVLASLGARRRSGSTARSSIGSAVAIRPPPIACCSCSSTESWSGTKPGPGSIVSAARRYRTQFLLWSVCQRAPGHALYRATNGSDRSAALDLRNARFRSAIAEIGAPAHGMAKDELYSEAVRLERRACRLRRGAIAGLAGLAIIASISQWSRLSTSVAPETRSPCPRPGGSCSALSLLRPSGTQFGAQTKL